ncbi:hypothetical protein AB835_00720 [Candidatus Endobugula sertula]|uniref:Membrane fusion protein (MFP) family protein n=1 Tax=Candidatus Endobugula sertula TaxID=62101 RepID=A0A1D2QTZ2_9GAMM|nr:hypothetical protein AB835_00720 [Candidatus Endobugula sertula]
MTNLAIEERLASSRDKREPDFTKISQQYKGFEVEKIIDTQKNLFITKRKSKENKINILNKRIARLRDEIEGISSQKNAIGKKLKVLYKQKAMSVKLVESNNSPRNKLLEIEKKIASSEGKQGELKANIAKATQSIAETELEIENIKNEKLDELLLELQEVEVKISDLTEQLISTNDILKRTTIKSPTSGVVTDLQYHTIGAVISPASEIMYVVPKDDRLIIEARVNPSDIDNVEAGLIAKVQLTAFKAKKASKLNGQVLSVSADSLFDEITGEQYFLARIKIDEEEIKKLKSNIKLYPGMPAQTFIIIGSRSLFSYLFSPITDAGYKAFREE